KSAPAAILSSPASKNSWTLPVASSASKRNTLTPPPNPPPPRNKFLRRGAACCAPVTTKFGPHASPLFSVPSVLDSFRGRSIPHVRKPPPGRTRRNRSSPRHPPQRLGPSL